MFLIPAKAIIDDSILDYLKKLQFNNLINDEIGLLIDYDKSEFINQYKNWINNSQNFKIVGIDSFEPYVTNGVTESIINLHTIYSNVYSLSGDYGFSESFHNHQIISTIDDVKAKSCFIISYPFAETGNVHGDFDYMMQYCINNEIDVFIDCAYFGISKVKELNLKNYSCIKQVAFSLSKTFATGYMKIGILFVKDKMQSFLTRLNDWDYLSKFSMKLHSLLLKDFTADYIYDKYRKIQVNICNEYELVPSDTVIFGINSNNKWKDYKRTNTNRICLSIKINGKSII